MNVVTLIGHEYEEGIESNLRELLESQGKEVRIIELYPFSHTRYYPKILFIMKILANRELVRRSLERRIIRLVAASKSDLVIFFTPAADLYSQSVVKSVKKHSKFVIAWILDSPINLRNSEFVTSEYDCLFISDRGYLRNLTGFTRARMFPLSEGYELEKYSVAEDNRNHDVVLVGSLYPTRLVQLSHLLEAGLRVSVYTNEKNELSVLANEFSSTLQVFGPVYGIERYRVFRNALCVLNLQHPSSIDIVNYRVFEVISCGGILATNGGETIKHMFASGGAIIFETDVDLISSINMLLKNPAYCEEQRTIAKDIAMRNTLALRFQEIVDTLQDLGN
jgi:hypothetical protein